MLLNITPWYLCILNKIALFFWNRTLKLSLFTGSWVETFIFRISDPPRLPFPPERPGAGGAPRRNGQPRRRGLPYYNGGGETGRGQSVRPFSALSAPAPAKCGSCASPLPVKGVPALRHRGSPCVAKAPISSPLGLIGACFFWESGLRDPAGSLPERLRCASSPPTPAKRRITSWRVSRSRRPSPRRW